MPRLTLHPPLGLAVALGLCAGCTSPPPAPTPSGIPFEVSSYAPELRDYHSSWGHAGRGGAVLRKPTYQAVLGSSDTLDSRAGTRHPELQPPAPTTASIQVPAALIAARCAEPASVAQAFAAEPAAGQARIVTLANSTGSVADYIGVRNKLCQGAQRLTFEEWTVLVNGTPKDVPLRLAPTPRLTFE